MARCPATRLTLEYLRLQGMLVDVVERRIPMKPFPITKDLFGIFDVLAIDKSRDEILFVQTTSASNRSSRRKKMESAYDVMSALVYPGSRSRVVLHTWRKIGRRWEINVQMVSDVTWDHKHDCIPKIENCCFPTMAELRKKNRLKQDGERVKA